MVLYLAILLIALLAFANGANDVSKAVATLVGSGVTDYRRALRWGAVWTGIGALLGGLLASSLAERFARSLGVSARHNAAIPLAVLLASLAWVAFCSRAGLPVSTTHAIAGAILGVAWMAEGVSPLAQTDMLKGFIVPLLASPLAALALTSVLTPLVARAGRWLSARCVCLVPAPGQVQLLESRSAAVSPALGVVTGRIANCEARAVWAWNLSLDQAHWVSSMLVNASRGMNDGPKIWALTFPIFLFTGANRQLALPAAIITVAISMGLGSWVGGGRVTEFLAERVTRMNHPQGFAANLATALLVAGASRLGLPVSTTHVSSGAIIGVGLGQGRGGVNRRAVGQIAMAWVVTLPVTALAAMACYWILK